MLPCTIYSLRTAPTSTSPDSLSRSPARTGNPDRTRFRNEDWRHRIGYADPRLLPVGLLVRAVQCRSCPLTTDDVCDVTAMTVFSDTAITGAHEAAGILSGIPHVAAPLATCRRRLSGRKRRCMTATSRSVTG